MPRGFAAVPVLAVALVVGARSVRGDDFSGFRIPEHTASSTSANLSGNSQGSSNDFARLSFGNLIFATRGFWWHESDRGLSQVTWDGNVIGDRRLGTSNNRFPQIEMASSNDRRMIEHLLVNAIWRRYPWAIPIGLGVSVAGSGDWTDRWFRGNGLTSDTLGTRLGTDSERSWFAAYAVTGALQAGYGKVRDASGIYAARVMEKRLRDAGVLARPLTAEGVQKLAQLVYVQPDVSAVHDRGDKYFWRELERILREDGALGDAGLDAWSVFRSLEPVFPGTRFFRLRGSFLGAALSGHHGHALSRSRTDVSESETIDGLPPAYRESHSTTRNETEEDRVTYGPVGQLHLPLGLDWQLDVAAQADITIPNDQIDRATTEISSIDLTWLVADRWWWAVDGTQIRYTFRPKGVAVIGSDGWNTRVQTLLRYFIEDRLSAELAAGQDQTGGPGYSRSGFVRFGIGYDLFGRFSAPGLYAPQRLTPPTTYGP